MKNKRLLVGVAVVTFGAILWFGSGLLYQGRFSLTPFSFNFNEEESYESYNEEEDVGPEINLSPSSTLNSGLDSDKDGLSNGREAILGTDASDTDTDDGGICDGHEVLYHDTDPLDSSDDATPVHEDYIDDWTC